MSAATNSPTEPTDPDPRAAPPMPAALNRVLNVVRRLIAIGQQLIATVHQRAAAPDFWLFAKPFGTSDLALIIDRIKCGLRRAAALEAALCQRAARGKDVTPSPFRMPSAGKPRAERQPPPPAAQPEPEPQPEPTPAQDPRLARLPTEAEIAAEIRRRPIGAVIVSICEDLGITPGDLDRAFWDELSLVIIGYGGSHSGWIGKLNKRIFYVSPEELANPTPFRWPDPPPQRLAPTTGPPEAPA
jgi:hypothetical protein